MLRSAIPAASPYLHASPISKRNWAVCTRFTRRNLPHTIPIRKALTFVRRMFRYLQIQTPPLSAQKSDIPDTPFRWTGSLVELVEIIYAFDEIGCINDGENDIKELAAFFGQIFGLEIKDSHCYNAYTDIKRCKSESRTYFLDKLRERLNLRMQRDEEKERARR